MAMPERDSWGKAAGARVSDRWARAAADWNTAITEELLKAAEINDDSLVLDLAAGSGDPAFNRSDGESLYLDLVVGLGIALINADSAEEIYQLAREEQHTTST